MLSVADAKVINVIQHILRKTNVHTDINNNSNLLRSAKLVLIKMVHNHSSFKFCMRMCCNEECKIF